MFMQQNVLVIENSHTSLEIVSKLVRKAGLNPIGARSLMEARARFSQMMPESCLCAIVAYSLPDAPHGEAADATIAAYIPTIVVTDSVHPPTREHILTKDVVDYIPKENAQNYDYLSRLLARLEKNKSTGVIVVSTHRKSRKNMLSMLHKHNFVVFDCPTASDAMQHLANNKHIRLVITDYAIPDMTGTEFVSTLRKAFAKEQLAIMGIAGGENTLLSALFIKSGANDFIHRPYSHEEFLCRVMQNVEYIESVEAIRRAANSDYLTGLPNRRHFFYTVTVQQSSLPDSHALALIDLDHFKSINDTYGHDAGDEVLKVVASVIEEQFPDEVIARFGGEEFCIYFPETHIDDVIKLLNTFRETLADTVIRFNGETLRVTCSVGVSTLNTQNIEAMLSNADKALYEVKRQGRNQVLKACTE